MIDAEIIEDDGRAAPRRMPRRPRWRSGRQCSPGGAYVISQ
jgi:hypothetical protein